MSDSSPVISSENLPTVTATAFVLVLLSIAFGAVNYYRTTQVAVAVAAFEVKDSNQENAASQAADKRVADLEARLAALEGKVSATATATATDADAAPEAAE